MFCDSEVNQTILHLLIKNLIQSRYKMLYIWQGGKEGKITAVFLHKGFGCFLREMSQLLDTVFNAPQHFEATEKKNTVDQETGNLSCTECEFLLLLKIILIFYY